MQHAHQTNKHEIQNTTKKHIELITGSLLKKREEWERLGRHLSEGDFLIVLPEGYRNRLGFIKRLAQKLREAGRDVEIHTI